MSRAINLSLGKEDVLAQCATKQVGVSAIEPLPRGGVRLVCMSSYGADLMRRLLKAYIIQRDVTRERYRPTRPLW